MRNVRRERGKSKKSIKWVVIVALAAAAGAAAWIAAGQGSDGLALSVCSPVKEKISETAECSGFLEGAETQTAVLPAMSRVTEVCVAKGDTVKRGDPLFVAQREIAAVGSFGGTKVNETVEAVRDGVVTSVYACDGLYLPADAGIVTVSSTDRLVIRAELPEAYYPDVTVGDEANVSVNAFPANSYTGKVVKIMPYANQSGGILAGTGLASDEETVVETLIELDGDNPELIPGLGATAEIVTETRDNALTLPYSAVLYDDNGKPYVFKLYDGTAMKKYVLTGEELDEAVEIKSGVHDGETVILDPPDDLRDGMKVTASEAEK